MLSLAERIQRITGFNPALTLSNEPPSPRKSSERDTEITTYHQEPEITVVSDNSAKIAITFPHPHMQVEGLPFLRITKQFTHHGISSLDDRFLVLTASGALHLLTRLMLTAGEKSEKEEDLNKQETEIVKTEVSRRDFLKMLSALAFLGSGIIAFGSKRSILGLLAQTGAQAVGYQEVKALMAHFDPLRAFIGGVLQPKERKETYQYSADSLTIEFQKAQTLHTEPDYVVSSVPISWNQQNMPNATDELFIYEPTDTNGFRLQLDSALAHPYKNQDAIGYQVGVFLRKLIEQSGLTAKYWSYNRYNEPTLGMQAVPLDSVMTDPGGLPSPVNYMHTGPLFLSFHPYGKQKPLFATVPSWTAQTSMGWGGCVTTETPLNLIEWLCMANEYACWSPDMLTKYKELSAQQKEIFVTLFASKIKDHWGGIPTEHSGYSAYNTILVFSKDGAIQIRDAQDFAAEIKQKNAQNTLEKYLSNYHIIRPVSLVDLESTDNIPERELDLTNIAINFAVIKNNKCIGYITANQNRRVNMNQLRKIAQLWLENKGLDYANSYLVGMDEHGGGEVVHATDIQ